MATRVECTPADTDPAQLAAPARNRYFYGKLLDQYHLDLEQRYFNRKRWLLNRLSLGAGVLCGLEVRASADGAAVRVGPGVAIDYWGREIVVPAPSRPVDPRQPTDECGRPDGPPLRQGGRVTLVLCYHECGEEPAPALVTTCEPETQCEHGLVRERFRLRIVRGTPDDLPGVEPGIVTGEQCARIFGEVPEGRSRLQLVCDTLAGACPLPRDPCVPLATILLGDNGQLVEVDECAVRPTVYSNAVLLDLILCLAARVDECCGPTVMRALARVSGDNQTAPAGQPVADPLVVRVTEGGNPVEDEVVTFTAAGGAVGDDPASLGPAFDVATAADGTAALPIWRLGPAPGVQRVRASIAHGMPAAVLFHARATPAALDLPVIRAVWPPNATRLSARSPDARLADWMRRWLAVPRVEVTFNHQMAEPQLRRPDPWLRVFALRSFGQNEIQVTPWPIRYAGPTTTPTLGAPGFTEVWALGNVPTEALDDELGVRFLVLARAEAGSIVDAGSPPLLLDAEFGGTQLARARLDDIWGLTDSRWYPQAVWDALVDTGAVLPQSGDGAEGGMFESWFQVGTVAV